MRILRSLAFLLAAGIIAKSMNAVFYSPYFMGRFLRGELGAVDAALLDGIAVGLTAGLIWFVLILLFPKRPTT